MNRKPTKSSKKKKKKKGRESFRKRKEEQFSNSRGVAGSVLVVACKVVLREKVN